MLARAVAMFVMGGGGFWSARTVNRRRLEVRTRMRLTDAHSVRPRTMKPAAETTLRPRGRLSQVGTFTATGMIEVTLAQVMPILVPSLANVAISTVSAETVIRSQRRVPAGSTNLSGGREGPATPSGGDSEGQPSWAQAAARLLLLGLPWRRNWACSYSNAIRKAWS